MYLYNDPSRKTLRQYLRDNVPRYERVLWEYLRGRSLCGLKFRRQYGVGRYVLDFYCPEIRLAIEIDGLIHQSSKVYDEERDIFLRTHGIRTLRISNQEMETSLAKVLRSIEEYAYPLLNTGGG